MSAVKIPLVRPSMPTMQEYIEEIAPLWENHMLTNMAPKHQTLENELKKFLAVQQFQLFVNGHYALEAALQAFSLEGEVITTPFTFASTVHAIRRCGLKPVFCDIRAEDYTLDASKLEALITEKTSAILPVHVYGMVCDVEQIQKIAHKNNLKVIYDAAHAFGVTVEGQGIANFGDATMFSFHATKAYHTIEGGGLAFSDKNIANKLIQLKDFGITGTESVEIVAGNGKMDEFRAAMGICNLRYFEQNTQARKRACLQYDARLSQVKGIQLLPTQEGVVPNYSYYPIVLHQYRYTRDELHERLLKHGVLTRKYFYPLCSEFDCYREEYQSVDLSVAQNISKNVLCLPLFSEITQQQIDKICNIILT